MYVNKAQPTSLRLNSPASSSREQNAHMEKEKERETDIAKEWFRKQYEVMPCRQLAVVSSLGPPA